MMGSQQQQNDALHYPSYSSTVASHTRQLLSRTINASAAGSATAAVVGILPKNDNKRNSTVSTSSTIPLSSFSIPAYPLHEDPSPLNSSIVLPILPSDDQRQASLNPIYSTLANTAIRIAPSTSTSQGHSPLSFPLSLDSSALPISTQLPGIFRYRSRTDSSGSDLVIESPQHPKLFGLSSSFIDPVHVLAKDLSNVDETVVDMSRENYIWPSPHMHSPNTVPPTFSASAGGLGLSDRNSQQQPQPQPQQQAPPPPHGAHDIHPFHHYHHGHEGNQGYYGYDTGPVQPMSYPPTAWSAPPRDSMHPNAQHDQNRSLNINVPRSADYPTFGSMGPGMGDASSGIDPNRISGAGPASMYSVNPRPFNHQSESHSGSPISPIRSLSQSPIHTSGFLSGAGFDMGPGSSSIGPRGGSSADGYLNASLYHPGGEMTYEVGPDGKPRRRSDTMPGGQGRRGTGGSGGGGAGMAGGAGESKRKATWSGGDADLAAIKQELDYLAQTEREVAELKADLPQGDRKQRRRMQNRLAQRAFRARSKVHHQEVSKHINDLEDLADSQADQIERLNSLVERLQRENYLLRKATDWSALGLDQNPPAMEPSDNFQQRGPSSQLPQR